MKVQVGEGRSTHLPSSRSEPSLQSHHFLLPPSVRSTHSKFMSESSHSAECKHGCQYLPMLYRYSNQWKLNKVPPTAANWPSWSTNTGTTETFVGIKNKYNPMPTFLSSDLISNVSLHFFYIEPYNRYHKPVVEHYFYLPLKYWVNILITQIL